MAIAQINVTVGDIKGNAACIENAYRKALQKGAELVVFPELALVGYPPEDLVLMPSFQQAAMQQIKQMAAWTKNSAGMIVGGIWQHEGVLYNCAFLLDDGHIQLIQPKRTLPNYGVFDEKRLFHAGDLPKPVEWRGVKLGLLICEDAWTPHAGSALAALGAELLIVINASPFEQEKMLQRLQVSSELAGAVALPLLYINMVGGQDDLVFDGGSFVLNQTGQMTMALPEFVEAVELVDFNNPTITEPMGDLERIWQACMLGLRDYLGKNGFEGVLLGLSGGIDSAVTAAMAVDALGADKVKGILLPSPYTSNASTADAEESARLLGIEICDIPIIPGMKASQEMLNPVMGDDWMENPAIGGNLQARLRGLSLMAFSNRFGWLLLNTSNKSESAVGYSTLYGDACGAYSLLKDIYKTEVYALAHWRNTQSPAIPENSLKKAPSAELKPNQTDQDQLPPYEWLDALLKLHIEGRLGMEEIAAQGYDAAQVAYILKLVRQSEYKRRQSCPGVKISPMQFGRERRFPLTNGWAG